MEHNKQQPIVVGIIVVLAVSLIVYKSRNDTSQQPENEPEGEQPPEVVAEEQEDPIVIKTPKFVKPKYPHCLRNDSGELQDLVVNLVEDMTTCDPTDILTTSSCPDDDSEGRGGMVVVYTAVSLLLASLAAAAVEVWRVRTRQGLPTASATRDPPQLSRRCSLADLTVLRHNRREFMLRRDSAMHMSVDSGTEVVNARVQHQHRVPLKLLGSSKSQDDGGRRGSIALSKACKWQRSVSADKADENVPDVHHHRIHMIRHH